MRGRLSFCFLGLVLLLCFTLLANVGCTKKENSPLVFQRQGWVSDYADALKPEEKSRISQELEAYEKETCHQIYLLIIPSVAGENITDFSCSSLENRADRFRQWFFDYHCHAGEEHQDRGDFSL